MPGTAGLPARETHPRSTAAPRQVLTLTGTGRAELRDRPAAPERADITDENRWFVLPAFLRHLPEPSARAEVLRRRLVFLEEPTSVYYEGDRPLRTEELEDPFRRGVLTVARATGEVELGWLRTTLESLDGSL